MNWWVGTGALAIGVAAFAARSPAEIPFHASSKPAPQEVVERLETVREIVSFRPVEVPARTESASIPGPAPVVETAREADAEDAALDRERVRLKLETLLDLTPEQSGHFDQVLREREVEIAALHAGIRASRVLWTWGYEKRVREILAGAQARMLSVLNSDQARRFLQAYEEKKVTEGVSFEVTPDITVLR